MSYFTEIQTKYSLPQLFEVGPYNRFPTGKRVELAGAIESATSPTEKSALLDKVFNQIVELVKLEFEESEKLFVIKFEEHSEIMESSLSEVLKSICIEDFQVIDQASYEDEENELFCFLYLIDLSDVFCEKLIKAFLARHIDLEPYIMAELFFVSNKLCHLANIYDDRGIDFIRI